MCRDAREPPAVVSPLRRQPGAKVTFSAAEGCPGPTSGDPPTLQSQGMASVPPRDQAGLYSPGSSAGVSPDWRSPAAAFPPRCRVPGAREEVCIPECG